MFLISSKSDVVGIQSSFGSAGGVGEVLYNSKKDEIMKELNILLIGAADGRHV